jgi:hypothetical protein
VREAGLGLGDKCGDIDWLSRPILIGKLAHRLVDDMVRFA